MATGGNYLTIPGLVASGDLSSNQYYAVKLASTAGAVILAAAGTDAVIGILQNDPTSGQPAEVACAGCAIGLAEGAITAGTFVTSNSSGELQTTTTGNDDVLGKAIEAATSQGDLILVALSLSNY